MPISKLFGRRLFKPAKPNPEVPAGHRIYAIGDIHGRLDLLKELLTKIVADNIRRGDANVTLILLGDLVDRGPESAQVVEHLMHFPATHPQIRVKFLAGNHEEVFLLALRGNEEALRLFNRIGGRETMLSYGISAEAYDAMDYEALHEAMCSNVPQSQIDFMNNFENMIIIGDYAFVHAGIRPNAPLADQKNSDLRWIRSSFLDFTGAHEKYIIHGHTITADVDEQGNRLGIDTGAFSSGKLTAVGLEGSGRWFLQT